MIALPASCSTWILPLLLLLHLFIPFYLSHAIPLGLHEFSRNVESFGDMVKKCPESCSPSHRMNESCQCFNFSVSPQECGFPEYFIQGLKSHPSISRDEKIKALIDIMEGLGQDIDTKFNFCSSGTNNKVFIMSPERFHKELKEVMEQLNSYYNLRR